MVGYLAMLFKIFALLSKRERYNALLLLVAILVMAILDVLGVASIMPFMAVLLNPDLVYQNEYLLRAYVISNQLGVDTPQRFLFVVGSFVFILLIFSLAFKALTTYLQLRFTLMREYSIGRRLVAGYLCQPYSWFLNKNSAEIGKNVLSEVNFIVNNVMLPMMRLVSQAIVAGSIIVLLVIVDPVLAISVSAVLISGYLLIYKVVSVYLDSGGQHRFSVNESRYVAVNEAFSAIKELKVNGLEQRYIERFAEPSKHYARLLANAEILNQVPRFALEAVSFGGMLLLILFLMAQKGDFAAIIPTIALYAFAGYRLMPALQQIYGAATQLRFGHPALNALYNDFLMVKEPPIFDKNEMQVPSNSIALREVTYKYPGATHASLNKINIEIPIGSRVAFVGTTGSGKTTAIDLILGLLDAQDGALEVDGSVIDSSNKVSFQNAVSYVPQQIYLADDTVAANIAFGVDREDIDHEAVENAAKIANIYETIMSEMPEKFETSVGERGVRLSGGQRQRLGIARALYKNPSILVLDEATSALDNITEKKIVDAINEYGKDITLIFVAHRLSTIKNCDYIFLLQRGKLKAEGTFDNLVASNEQFRKMASLN